MKKWSNFHVYIFANGWEMSKLQGFWLEVEDEVYLGKDLCYIFMVLHKLMDVSPPQWLKRAPVTMRSWVQALAWPFSIFFPLFDIFLCFCSAWAILWAWLFLLTIPPVSLINLPDLFLFLFLFLFFLLFYLLFIIIINTIIIIIIINY